MSFNIELKARFDDLVAFEKKTMQLDSVFEGVDQQTDTFFNVPKGRLKLRESTLYGNFLIPYLRPDENGPKRSDYSLLAVSEVHATKRILEKMLGFQLVVEKVRKIFLYENVRIHLDQVKKLGDFVEFEAVVERETDVPANRKKLDFLIEYFGIKKNQIIAKAYADLLGEI